MDRVVGEMVEGGVGFWGGGRGGWFVEVSGEGGGGGGGGGEGLGYDGEEGWVGG